VCVFIWGKCSYVYKYICLYYVSKNNRSVKPDRKVKLSHTKTERQCGRGVKILIEAEVE
jgi:hypothetical protein